MSIKEKKISSIRENEDIHIFPFTRHKNFPLVIQEINKWKKRFFHLFDEMIYNEAATFFTIAGKNYLDRYSPKHLFRLALSIVSTYNHRLLHDLGPNSYQCFISVKFLPTRVFFPFSSKPVLGCLIGIGFKTAHEVIREEDLQPLLHKIFPKYQVISGTIYTHPTPNISMKLFYLEIEKKEERLFTIEEKKHFKKILKEKFQGNLSNVIQRIILPCNQEEIYKNILFLSQEIKSTKDLPHLMISLDQQKEDELIFLITLVYLTLKKPVDLSNLFLKECPSIKFVSKHQYPVAFLEKKYIIMAHIFQLHIPYTFKPDSRMHYYEGRRIVTNSLNQVLGDFRDCNGGLILKVDEQLSSLKEHFCLEKDEEIIENFFYSIIPAEKQATLSFSSLIQFVSSFLKGLTFTPIQSFDYYFTSEEVNEYFIIVIRLPSSPFLQTTIASFEELILKSYLWLTWSSLEIQNGLSLTIYAENFHAKINGFLTELREILEKWSKQISGKQVLRIALTDTVFSLDPRLGCDEQSSNLLRMLFEGLTRINSKGEVEEAVAKSISISSDKCQYFFTLRKSFWNDGTLVTAHDFLYAWEKTLSPHFSQSFAYFLYPILNARAIKDGRLDMEKLGVKVLDDYTLKVTLERPLSYFLELITHPMFFPIHRYMDQKFPQWPGEIGISYPCNGPFQSVNHLNYGYQFVKNPYYWDAPSVTFDQMIFFPVNPSEAEMLFQQEKIDWLGHPFGPWNNFSINNGEKYTLAEKTSFWCLLNTQKFPLNHVKFRKALHLSINQEFINQVCPSSEIATSILPENFRQTKNESLYNPILAKKYLEEFLQENKMTIDSLPIFKIFFPSKIIIHKKIAEYLAKNWTQVLGIHCKIEEEPWNFLFQRYTMSEFQIGLMRWVFRFNDPMYTLNAFRFSSNGVNFSQWNNKEFNSILEQVEKSCNESDKRKWIKKVEDILHNELPVIPLMNIPDQGIIRKGIDTTFLTRCGFKIQKN